MQVLNTERQIVYPTSLCLELIKNPFQKKKVSLWSLFGQFSRLLFLFEFQRAAHGIPGASLSLLLPVFSEVLYIWISRFTAPPQHVHFQLPISIYNLFLSTFFTKHNKTEGGEAHCLWGANTARNIVHELLRISIPQCYRQTVLSICSGWGHGVNRRRNALGRKYCSAMTQK